MSYPTSSSDYISAAVRTESDQFHPIDDTVFSTIITDFIAVGNALDAVKKALFYGKDLARVQSTTQTLTSQLSRRQQRLVHATLGIATEATELLEALASALTSHAEADEVNLLEELGDLMWYQAIACDEFGLTFEFIQAKNIAKLRARFPERFEQEQALVRDLGTERQVLEHSLDLEDMLDEAISDSISNDEGHIRARTLLRELAKQGWQLVPA